MTVTIDTQFDCTQREFVVDLAKLIYKLVGGDRTPDDLMYFFRSKHPAEKGSLAIAEEIFELLTGDYPCYDDDDLDEEEDTP